MQLALTEEESAFREEMRTFFTTKIPEEIRDTVRAGRHVGKDGLVSSMQIMNEAGIAVPNWPVEWGGQDWTPLQRHIWHEEMQDACVPPPLAFNANMIGPVIANFGSRGDEEGVPAEDRQPRHLVVPGLLRAQRRLRPRVADHQGASRTATTG